MGLPLTKRDAHFTYADYLGWPDDERWELIDGVAYNMCAAPSLYHQHVVGELFNQLKNYLKGKPCRVFVAPFDVLLPQWQGQDDESVDTVVQPDILLYCERDKLHPRGGRGAPSLVVEVLSPWTSRKDLNEKYRLYERVGVKEYWVIDPEGRSLQAYRLEAGTAHTNGEAAYGDPAITVGGGRIPSQALEGYVLELASLFDDLPI